MENIVSVRQISKSYGSVQAWKDNSVPHPHHTCTCRQRRSPRVLVLIDEGI